MKMTINNDYDEILSKPYRRVLVPDAEVGGYTAMIPEFPGCLAEGDTADQAIDALQSAARSWIEAALSQGQTIPEPERDGEYSGKIALRIPKSLHGRAVELAKREGISLNQFLVSTVAEKVGEISASNRFLDNLRQV